MNRLLQVMKPEEGHRFLFFGGKGGVGKTTAAAATAVWMADQGYQTTIVSTDPTVSLAAIFHQEISATEKTRIRDVANLHGVNINPSEARGVFQSRFSDAMGKITTTLGEDVIATPCMEEMAAFDQFVAFLDEQESQVVVFDTAPTGHSLREMAMPFDWANFLKKQVEQGRELAAAMGLGESADTMVNLEREKARYDRAMDALKDPERTIFSLVLLPAYLPIEETGSAIKDLGSLGIKVRSFLVNQLIPETAVQGNRFLVARYATQERYVSEIRRRFGHGVIKELPMLESDVHDLETLRAIGRHLYGEEA